MNPSVAAVVVSRGRLLLLRHDELDGETTWLLPQGVVADGESAEDAVVRETMLVAGMTVEVLRTLGEAPDGFGRMITYLACAPVDDASFTVDVGSLGRQEWCGQAELLHHLPSPFPDPVQRYIDTSIG
jgi:8-oxo-dGTP diphosphatase